LAEVKHQGELKFRHPEPLVCWRLLHITRHWKKRRVTNPMLPPHARWPTGLPPTCWPAGPLSCCPPTGQLTFRPARPLPHTTTRLQPTGPLGCCPANGLTANWASACWEAAHSPAHWHMGCHPPQEDSQTTGHQLQTCLGDADKQDWMLKE
jgi:hypothetical protein